MTAIGATKQLGVSCAERHREAAEAAEEAAPVNVDARDVVRVEVSLKSSADESRFGRLSYDGAEYLSGGGGEQGAWACGACGDASERRHK